MTDEQVRNRLLSIWRSLDAKHPPPRCDGYGKLPRPGKPICDGSGTVHVQCNEPVVVGRTAMVCGGAVDCPGCSACKPEIDCSGCEACTGIEASRAVETHCGGRGLVVGCPVCKRRWK